MYQVSYNGVQIDVCGTRVRLMRKEVSQGPNYLYTRTILHCQGIYSPGATAYTVGPKQAVLADSIKAPQTDVAIRNALWQQRRPLLYTVGGTTVISSPWTAAGQLSVPIDDNNGPKPLDLNVQQVHGTKSFFIELLIQTDVNERRLGGLTGQNISPENMVLVLSNTWSQQEDLNRHFFSTITTKGKCVLSTMGMQAIRDKKFVAAGMANAHLGGQADDWRAKQFQAIFNKPPVLPNFQREAIHCDIDENNNALNYVITDREQAVNLVGLNITEIRCTQTLGSETPDQFGVVYRRAKAFAEGTARGIAIGAAVGSSIPFIGSVIGGGAGGIAAGVFAERIENANPHNNPTAVYSWDMHLYGNNICTKQELLTAAGMILTKQISRANINNGQVPGGLGGGGGPFNFNLDPDIVAQLQVIQRNIDEVKASNIKLRQTLNLNGPLSEKQRIQAQIVAGNALIAALEAQGTNLAKNLVNQRSSGFSGLTKCRSAFDLLGKHLHVTLDINQSMGSIALNSLFRFGLAEQSVSATLPLASAWGDESVEGVFTRTATQANPVPPGDGVSRGRYVGGLNTQTPNQWQS